MNDERPIEKLLRRYAKQRRADAGAPVELHPATRRLLHGEIGRQMAGERRQTGGERQSADSGSSPRGLQPVWKNWLPRLAWAVPLFGLLAIGLWSLRDRPAPQLLALGPAPREETEADVKRVSKNERRAPAPRPISLVAAPRADSSVASGPPTATAPVLVRSLNSPAPGPAHQAVAGRNRDAEQALALADASRQPIVRPTTAAELNGEPARSSGKEITVADKLGMVSPAAPARVGLVELSKVDAQKLNESNPSGRGLKEEGRAPGPPATDARRSTLDGLSVAPGDASTLARRSNAATPLKNH